MGAVKNFKTDKPVLCIGDLIADMLIPYGESKAYSAALMEGRADGMTPPAPKLVCGGTNGNTVCGIAGLGIRSMLASRVGNDGTGRFLKRAVEEAGVDTRYVVFDDEHETLVSLTVIDEDRSFFVWPPENSAGQFYSEKDLPPDPKEFGWVHVSGAFFFLSPIAETVVSFMERCKQAGVPVSFDLNLRAEMFGLDERRDQLVKRAMASASVILGSIKDEICMVTGIEDELEAARSLVDEKTIVVSRDGPRPVRVFTNEEEFSVPPYEAKKIDATGAGDNFDCGFIAGMVSGQPLLEAVRWGNACSAYCIARKGGKNCPDMPTLLDIVKHTPVVTY